MTNQKTLFERVLKERKVEKDLKDYFKFMDVSYGEDFSSLILSSDIRPSLSLQMFTSKFPTITDTDIVLALIKSSILSYEKNNYANGVVKAFVEEGKFEELMNLVYSNLSIRKMLTRVFIHGSYGSNYEYYSKKIDDDNTFGNMLSILYFQNDIHSNKEKKKK